MSTKNQPAVSGILRIMGFSLILVFGLSACSGTPPVIAVSTSIQPLPEIVISPTPFAPEKVPEVTSIPTRTDAPTIPDPANSQWVAAFSGFTKPVELVSPPGDIKKIIVVEQPGTIRLQDGNTGSPGLFLDIRDRIGSGGSEQGLLGIAFHPQYAQNRFFYVNYTDHNGDTVIARFTASQTGETADPATEMRLIQVDQPYANHNGGGLAFGPDGYLYIGLGDGGSAGDPQNNAQNLNNLLGKILRIDVNPSEGYAIPADNPFAGSGGKPEIWAYGLRNPWRFSFDAGTGDLYIGDVGQNIWEEVDFLPAGSPGGANFGWSLMEGNHPYRNQGDVPGNLIYPITEYDHNSGCSITGGYVYRGQVMPDWQGVYLFGDYCRGTIWGLLRTSSGLEIKQIAGNIGNISSFGVDGAGEIYALEHNSGVIYKLAARQ